MVIVEDGLGVTGESESTCMILEDSGTDRGSGAASPERFFRAFEISLPIVGIASSRVKPLIGVPFSSWISTRISPVTPTCSALRVAAGA